MYKLIAVDLDGTLLDSHGEVSLENKEAILKAKENGVMTVIASRKDAYKCKKYCKRNRSR